MSECELLYGQALSDRVRLVCAEDEVDCAVAFLSTSVRDDLFPRWRKQTVRIVCDISMGCNSRSTLKAYGAPKNSNLRVRDGLHAKIYISAVGAIVASANASLNGLGLKNRPAGNMEAGAFFAPNSAGWSEAGRLFNELWQSPIIDKGQLARAPKLASDPGKRISPSGQQDTSLLQRVRGYPDQFASVLFMAEHERIDPEDEAKARIRYDAAEQAEEFEPKSRSLILLAEHDAFPPIPSNVIMFWHNGRGTRFEIIAYYNVVSVRSRKYTTLWGVKRWDRFWSNQGVQAPERSLTVSDQKFLTSLDEGSWVLSASDFSHALLVRG